MVTVHGPAFGFSDRRKEAKKEAGLSDTYPPSRHNSYGLADLGEATVLFKMYTTF